MKRQPAFRLPVAPDDVVRHALAAYYRAAGESVAPMGFPEPVEWSGPQEFVDTLVAFFELRLSCGAAVAGHPVEADHAKLAAWSNEPLFRDLHFSQVDPLAWAEIDATGAGQRPAAMAHGCAAVDAVGPALEAGQGGNDAATDDPLFVCPSGQELPAVAAAGSRNAAVEAARP